MTTGVCTKHKPVNNNNKARGYVSTPKPSAIQAKRLKYFPRNTQKAQFSYVQMGTSLCSKHKPQCPSMRTGYVITEPRAYSRNSEEVLNINKPFIRKPRKCKPHNPRIIYIHRGAGVSREHKPTSTHTIWKRADVR